MKEKIVTARVNTSSESRQMTALCKVRLRRVKSLRIFIGGTQKHCSSVIGSIEYWNRKTPWLGL